MQSVIAFSCLLAVASAGYLNSVAPLAYANHGSHAVAYNAPLVSAPHPVPIAHSYAVAPIAHHVAPIAHAVAPIAHAAPLVSEARLVDPVAIAAGAPLPTGDTVEVAAAKAFHAQAHVAAKNLAYSSDVANGYVHGAPIAHAYTHAAPIAHAYAHAAPIAHAYAAPVHHAVGLASEARLIDPVAIAAGAPLPGGDTVEVAAAKAFHHQAHVEAKTGHLLAKGHFIAKRSPGYLNAGYAGYVAPLAYASPVHSYGYSAYSPLAYSAYTGYGYGGHLGAYYG